MAMTLTTSRRRIGSHIHGDLASLVLGLMQ